MVTDFVSIPVDTPLLGAARAIADAQASQALSTCYGIVLEGKDGEVLGSATLRQVMNEVADVIKPLQIAFNEFDVDGGGDVRPRARSHDALLTPAPLCTPRCGRSLCTRHRSPHAALPCGSTRRRPHQSTVLSSSSGRTFGCGAGV